MSQVKEAIIQLEQIRDRFAPITERLSDIGDRMGAAKVDQRPATISLRTFTSNLLGQESLHQSETNDPDRALPPRTKVGSL